MSLSKEPSAPERRQTLVRAGCALVGRGLRPVTDATVVLGNGVVEAVGTGISPPRGDVVDARALTLVPGFIDAHVHIGFYAPARVLAGGVTTVRDLGWPPSRIFPLARRSAAAAFQGPAILAAGPMLTTPGGYPMRAAWAPAGTGWELEGSHAAAAAVARLVEEGACVVKVALNPPAGPVLDPGTLSAIVRAAHARSLRVTAHVHGVEALSRALDAGVDELAHMVLGEERLPDDLVEAMVRARLTVVPTLHIRTRRELDAGLDGLRRFLAGGGRVVYGTDLGNAGPRPGIDRGEITLMRRAGMPARKIIASATVEAADYLGLRRAGVIARGCRADLVAVDGNPLADPGCLARVRMVWRAGRRAR